MCSGGMIIPPLEDLGMVLIQTYAMLILSTLSGEMVLTTKQIA